MIRAHVIGTAGAASLESLFVSILFNGLEIDVTDLVCDPFPPVGKPIKLRFRCADNLRLQPEAMIVFTTRGLAYRGWFRLRGCATGDGLPEYSYWSVGSVTLTRP
jgi:hypothetical protein